ncbi:MAG: response regulator [Desulfobacteraceae bacterium]|nr:MAG: response regulator [Desulfobacteraceae bacterium]
MANERSYIEGKRILAVDDDSDILEMIEEILDSARVETAGDYEDASAKIRENIYDLAILDIMGVNGLKLLEEAVEMKVPTVMLTAHAVNPETLMESIRRGAIAYLPKEKLSELDALLNDLFGAYVRGEPPWKLLFDRLGDYFDERFGSDWKKNDSAFWEDFSRTFQIGRGIQKRLMRDDRIRSKPF